MWKLKKTLPAIKQALNNKIIRKPVNLTTHKSAYFVKPFESVDYIAHKLANGYLTRWNLSNCDGLSKQEGINFHR